MENVYQRQFEALCEYDGSLQLNTQDFRSVCSGFINSIRNLFSNLWEILPFNTLIGIGNTKIPFTKKQLISDMEGYAYNRYSDLEIIVPDYLSVSMVNAAQVQADTTKIIVEAQKQIANDFNNMLVSLISTADLSSGLKYLNNHIKDTELERVIKELKKIYNSNKKAHRVKAGTVYPNNLSFIDTGSYIIDMFDFLDIDELRTASDIVNEIIKNIELVERTCETIENQASAVTVLRTVAKKAYLVARYTEQLSINFTLNKTLLACYLDSLKYIGK